MKENSKRTETYAILSIEKKNRNTTFFQYQKSEIHHCVYVCLFSITTQFSHILQPSVYAVEWNFYATLYQPYTVLAMQNAIRMICRFPST